MDYWDVNLTSLLSSYLCRVISLSETSQEPPPDPDREVRIYICVCTRDTCLFVALIGVTKADSKIYYVKALDDMLDHSVWLTNKSKLE